MSRRKLVWARTGVQTIVLPAAASGLGYDPLAPFRIDMGILRNLPGTTVARVRISTFAGSLTSGTFPIWLGLRKATFNEVTEIGTDAAFALNNAPQRAETDDWMLWDAMYPNHGADVTTGLPNACTYEYDVKSMRKLDEAGETLLLMAGKETSVASVSVLTSISVLLMLP